MGIDIKGLEKLNWIKQTCQAPRFQCHLFLVQVWRVNMSGVAVQATTSVEEGGLGVDWLAKHTFHPGDHCLCHVSNRNIKFHFNLMWRWCGKSKVNDPYLLLLIWWQNQNMPLSLGVGGPETCHWLDVPWLVHYRPHLDTSLKVKDNFHRGKIIPKKIKIFRILTTNDIYCYSLCEMRCTF